MGALPDNKRFAQRFARAREIDIFSFVQNDWGGWYVNIARFFTLKSD